MDGALSFEALYAQLKPQCDEIIARYEVRRSALLPLVHLFQEHEGYASPQAMRAVAQMLDLSLAVVESTVSFYTLFFRKPVGTYVLQVCRGLACSLNGADDIMAYFRRKLGIGHLETTDDGVFSYEEVECLAACDRATCMQVNLEFVYDLTPQMIDDMIEAMRAGAYAVAPMVQTANPPRTWRLVQDTQVAEGGKSPGALDQPQPNNAGGLDKDGVIMLDRIITQEWRFKGRTKERLARIEPAIAKVLEDGAAH
ncbi:MAG TPA: NAD(P)H-dependent oxidoreductase subunit E [Candidatus Baltobacteraceae bacterium]|jgi:NADH-quinone oxidoreductase subunit E|nr:NAD(P)H-dependent oxidoreductase subunit E [Candidatus Baltobacteraceae bacterium]